MLFRLRFSNHKARLRKKHEKLSAAERERDDLLYKHLWQREIHMKVQLIDRVNGEDQLRDKEGQWAYMLKTVRPQGLNDDCFF